MPLRIVQLWDSDNENCVNLHSNECTLSQLKEIFLIKFVTQTGNQLQSINSIKPSFSTQLQSKLILMLSNPPDTR